jgi:hypothetical protein
MVLKSMSVDRLTSLREKVDTALRAKITKTRHELEQIPVRFTHSRHGGRNSGIPWR